MGWRAASTQRPASAGDGNRADELRRDSLGQIAAAGTFAEYFEPFTGKPLGSTQQSRTAAVALDWSAAECGGDASLHLEARRAYL